MGVKYRKGTIAWFGGMLVLSVIWFYLVGYSPAFIESEKNLLGSITPARLTFFVAYTLVALAAGFQPRRIVKIGHRLGLALPFILLIGSGMLTISAYQILLPVQTLASLGCLLMGSAHIWISLNIRDFIFTQLPLRNIALIFIFSYAVSNLLYTLIFLIASHEQQMILSLVLPLLMVFCYSFCLKSIRRDKEELVSKGRVVHVRVAPLRTIIRYRTQLGALAGTAITLVTLRAISTGGIWGGAVYADQPASPLLLASFVSAGIFLVIAIPVFLLYARQSSSFVLVLPFLVLVAFMLILTFTRGWATAPELNSVIERYCQTLMALVVAVGVKSLPTHPYRVIGFAAATNYILALAWMFFLEGLNFEVSLIILLLSYVSVIAIAMIKSDNSAAFVLGKASEESSDSLVSEVMNARCAELSVFYGLTVRETEILLLLARGRSIPYIQEKLYLANGTVKTHTKHIYKKLGVHSKQELLNLVEGGLESSQDFQ
jgi:DNA-binding CsgD family transcriptional regulator